MRLASMFMIALSAASVSLAADRCVLLEEFTWDG